MTCRFLAFIYLVGTGGILPTPIMWPGKLRRFELEKESKRWNIQHSDLFKMQKKDHNPYLRFVYKNASAANRDHDSNSDWFIPERNL